MSSSADGTDSVQSAKKKHSRKSVSTNADNDSSARTNAATALAAAAAAIARDDDDTTPIMPLPALHFDVNRICSDATTLLSSSLNDGHTRDNNSSSSSSSSSSSVSASASAADDGGSHSNSDTGGRVVMTRTFVAALSALVLKLGSEVARDASAFARHANRKTGGADYVLRALRPNPEAATAVRSAIANNNASVGANNNNSISNSANTSVNGSGVKKPRGRPKRSLDNSSADGAHAGGDDASAAGDREQDDAEVKPRKARTKKATPSLTAAAIAAPAMPANDNMQHNAMGDADDDDLLNVGGGMW